MTEQTKQEIRDGIRNIRKAATLFVTIEFIEEKIAKYNEVRLEDEPEMTFSEMVGLLQEKLIT